MKILKPGVPAEDAPPWWFGKRVKCEKCGCEAQLEGVDAFGQTGGTVEEHAERHPGGRRWITLRCPEKWCDAEISLSRVTP